MTTEFAVDLALVWVGESKCPVRPVIDVFQFKMHLTEMLSCFVRMV